VSQLLLVLAALPLVAGVASASERLTDAQLDRISAGAGVCLVSVPTDGMTCLVLAGGIPVPITSGPSFSPSAATTIISDLQKFFNIIPNSPADISPNVVAIPLPR